MIKSGIQQWKPNRVRLMPGQVYTYNASSEQTNIFQIINRKATGGGVVFADVEGNVSDENYMTRVDQGSNMNMVLPYQARQIYLYTNATQPLDITIIEITSDDILFTFGAAQLINISGNVQVQEPVTVTGGTKVTNDYSQPIPIMIMDSDSAIPIFMNDHFIPDVKPIPIKQIGATPAGSNLIGKMDVNTLPSIPAGSAIIGKVDVNTLPTLATLTTMTTGNVVAKNLPATITTAAITTATPFTQAAQDAGATMLYTKYRAQVVYDQPVTVDFYNGISATLTSNKIQKSQDIPANTPTVLEFPLVARYCGVKITNKGAATTNGEALGILLGM